jgi:hypothetical protein
MRVYHQDQISVKFDDGVLFELEKEQAACGSSRNRLINRSVIVYTKLCDLVREYRLGQIDEIELARAIDKDILFQQSARHM